MTAPKPYASAPPRGLTTEEAARRLAVSGPNEIQREPSRSPLTLFAQQFASPVVWLLAAAATVSALLGELVDAAAIGAIVIVNALVGFLQEHRAEKALLALRSMTDRKSVV